MTPNSSRELDLVIVGATGYTGRLVAEYLARKKPALRWGLGGRNGAKLLELRQALSAREPALVGLPLRTVDTNDTEDVDQLASTTRVICTTVGPYARYGSALVDACARHGTHYCDLTGEVDWARAMIDAHHDRAAASGARIVTSCGFDSVPSDLGVLLLHDHLAKRGEQLARAQLRVLSTKGGASGGSIASGLALAERMKDPAVRAILDDPYSLCPPNARSGPDGPTPVRPRRDPATGHYLAPFVMAVVNERVVRRSNALLGFPYGRSFTYEEAVDTGAGPLGLARAAAISAATKVAEPLVSFGLARNLLARALPGPGAGPTQKQRENGSFRLLVRGESTRGAHAQVRLEADLDPGYGATAVMLAEAALSLAQDPLSSPGGLLTPAACFGLRLAERLRDAGLVFDAADDDAPYAR